MNKISILALAIAGIMTTGCGVIKRAPAKTATVTETAPTAETGFNTATQLAPAEMNGEWAIVNVNGKDVKVNGDNHPNLSFVVDENMPGAVSVIGFNGCNYINGTFYVEGTKLTPGGEFISTMKACHDAPYEYDINQALDHVVSYGINHSATGYTMALNNASGTPLIVLRKHDIAFLNGAWKVDAINGNAVPASADVKIVIDLDQKSLHGNAGCNIVNGSLILTLDKENGIEFKDLVTTRMTCPDIATEQAFLLALENVSSAARDGSDNKAVLRDSDGNAVITLTRIDPKQAEM